MAVSVSLGQESGRSALSVAAFIARPLSLMTRPAIDRWLSDVQGRDLRPMLDAQAARQAVEHYVGQMAGVHDLVVEATFLANLSTRPSVVTAVEIALAPVARLDRLRAFVIGAICRDTIRAALLKTDRQAVNSLLGADVQEFAARQAATFYPALHGLAPSIAPALRSADGTPFAGHPVRALAARVVSAAIGQEARIAADILSIRENGAVEHGMPVPLTPAQSAEVLRLWRREVR